jgi:ribose/xylose/arabinose/galactoside ABC-type transport system permease subunit
MTPRNRDAALGHIIAVAPALVLIVLYGCFSVLSSQFSSAGNLQNIVLYASILLIVSASSSFVVLLGCIDLSVGAVATVSGVATALLVPSLGLAAGLVGVAVGLAVGAVNGWIHVALRIPSFLATLGMMTALTGISLTLTRGSSIPILDERFNALGRGTLVAGVPKLGAWALVVFVALAWIDRSTLFGRHVMAIGGAERTAGLVGLPVRRYKIIAFALSGAIAALAGVLLSARLGNATVAMGESLTLQVITAVVLGGTAISGGEGAVWRSLVGVLVISVVANGLDLLAVHPYLQTIIKGSMVLIAVMLMSPRRRAVAAT